MIFLPLFSSISSKNYSGTFLLGAFVGSFSASAAVYYSDIHKIKIKNCKKNKDYNRYPIFCEINKNKEGLLAINIFIKTMILLLIFSYILFILFGYGGGSLHNYYKPRIIAIKRGLIDIVILLNIYFWFHYFSGYYIMKYPPKLKNTLRGTLYDLGLRDINLPGKQKYTKNEKNNYIFFQILLIVVFSSLIFLSIKLSNSL